MKVCRICELSKPFSDFYKRATSKDGFRSECKCCFIVRKKNRYQLKKEQIKTKQKQYYKIQKGDHYRKYAREKYREQKFQNPEINKIKYLRNPKIYIEIVRRRRLRKQNVPGTHTLKEWHELCAQFNFQCLRCRNFFELRKLTRDHVIPISKGGTDYIGNIQPLCRSCNSIKSTNIIDFRNSKII